MKRIPVIAVALLAIAATSSFAAVGLFDLGAGAAPTGVTTDGSAVAFDLGGANIWYESTAASTNIGANYTTAGVAYTTYNAPGGKYVVGGNSGSNAQRWDSNTGVWTQLPLCDGSKAWTAQTTAAMSDMSNIYIGGGYSTGACRYKESSNSSTTLQYPSDANPTNYGWIYGVSDTGHYAGKYKVGGGAKKADATPYAGGNLMGLNYLGTGSDSGTAFAISRDGRYAGGYSRTVPAVWDLSLANGGSGIQIPWLTADYNYGEVHALNQAGSMAYGFQRTAGGVYTAFVWDAVNGTRELGAYLAGKGINVSGWTFTDVKGVSGDDRVLTGLGDLAGGSAHGWVIVIPEPSSFCALALGLAGLLKFRRRRV
jgi:hypothetical protein